MKSQSVQHFIDNVQNLTQKRLLYALRSLIFECSEEIEEKIKYNVPFYSFGKDVIYLNTLPNNGVDLCFLHGDKMEHIVPEMVGKTRKKITSIQLFGIQELNDNIVYVKQKINEALIINEQLLKQTI